MNVLKLSVAALALSLSSLTFASTGGDQGFTNVMNENQKSMTAYSLKKGKEQPQIQRYRYGMKLDIAKVVNVTAPIESCNIVPSRMTYEDSAGQLNTIEYRVMGVCRNNGS